jgi:DNA-binding NarL/FixJ family response regulator
VLPRVHERLKLVRTQSDSTITVERKMRQTNILNSDGSYLRKLRILIADDHGLLRHGVRTILQARRGWKVVGEATNGREAVDKAIKLKPDVLVVDISMPELDGVEVTRQIRKALPEVKVLVLTMHESDQMVRQALNAGANGYLLKSDLPDYLPKAVKAIAENKSFLTPKISEIVLEGFINAGNKPAEGKLASPRITPRELEIVRLLAQGKSNKELSTQLGITVRTVETHRSKIMLKLGVHSLAELIHYAMRNEIISVKGPE